MRRTHVTGAITILCRDRKSPALAHFPVADPPLRESYFSRLVPEIASGSGFTSSVPEFAPECLLYVPPAGRRIFVVPG